MSNDASLDINQKSNPVQTVAQLKEDNNMLRATDKITALYCRLSVEDTKEKGGKDDPLNSIQHQQIMLMEYAKSRHFPNPTYFIDDGYSGVDFSNRPGFKKMLAEIEAGHVEVVITKDLSRLGRNSSLTGLYINYTFPQYGVRCILPSTTILTPSTPTAPTATWQASRTGSMSGIPRIPAAKSVPSTRQRVSVESA